MHMTAQDTVASAVPTHIREVLASNLVQDTADADRVLVVFLSPSSQLPGYYLDWVTTVSFQILYNSSFIYHTTRRCHARILKKRRQIIHERKVT
jgi:hypothetical protein